MTSSLISLSVNMTAAPRPVTPACLYSGLKSSSRLFALYVFVSWIWKKVAYAMYAPKRVRDCLPEPPTPTSSAQPRERPKRRVMRVRCSRAVSYTHLTLPTKA